MGSWECKEGLREEDSLGIGRLEWGPRGLMWNTRCLRWEPRWGPKGSTCNKGGPRIPGDKRLHFRLLNASKKFSAIT